MPLPPFYLLVPIVPLVRNAPFAILDRLGVDNPEAGGCLVGVLLPHQLMQPYLHSLPNTANQPLAEVVVHRTPRPELPREHSPLAARFQLVEHGIPDLTQVYFTFPLVVQNILYTLPLAIG